MRELLYLKIILPPPGGFFDLDTKKTELERLEQKMNESGFWKNQEQAKKITEQHAGITRELDSWNTLRTDVEDIITLTKDAKEASDESLSGELEDALKDAESRFEKLEFTVLLSGEHDSADAIIAFHAGSGGTEAMDWTEMLLRMITRYIEKSGWKAKVVDMHRGGEAGIKSAMITVEGRYAYGTLKSEHGVHRLVRISPFDAEKMRHTSFALLEVLPDLGEIEEVEIDQKDIRVDTFLASGHGGQSVQTTYSAVRITHTPTGIVVTCQNERSQQQNRETAMKILKARLAALAEVERQKEKQELRGEYTSAEWGNQIRSYVLHPYQMVKDHRTGHETSDTNSVLDGNLEEFTEIYLRWVKEGRPKRKSTKDS